MVNLNTYPIFYSVRQHLHRGTKCFGLLTHIWSFFLNMARMTALQVETDSCQTVHHPLTCKKGSGPAMMAGPPAHLQTTGNLNRSNAQTCLLINLKIYKRRCVILACHTHFWCMMDFWYRFHQNQQLQEYTVSWDEQNVELNVCCTCYEQGLVTSDYQQGHHHYRHHVIKLTVPPTRVRVSLLQSVWIIKRGSQSANQLSNTYLNNDNLSLWTAVLTEHTVSDHQLRCVITATHKSSGFSKH